MVAPVVVVAASSARMLAESARRAGMRPIALDLFGDLDTRRAAHWLGVGSADGLGVDAQRMQAMLGRLARRSDVLGWVAGGGFEDCAELMQTCAQALPLIGNDLDTLAAMKQPGRFFPMLDDYGIRYPETRLTPPSSPSGWLSKSVGGTGGGHVRRVRGASPHHANADQPVPETAAPLARYYQRESPGVPMSALFLADGADVLVIAFNRLLVGPVGRRPFVFQGAVGPVSLSDEAGADARRAVDRIARHAGLVGLNSMDFLLDGEAVSVLEINPRPSATMDLHDDWLAGGLLKAHIDACRQRLLPREAPSGRVSVKGFRIAYARRRLVAGAAGRRRLQELDWCHDIGPEGTVTARGGPLCTVSAEAHSAEDVWERLAQRVLEAQRIHEEDDGS